MKHLIAAIAALAAQEASTETLLGTKAISPGISLTFEAAARDAIYPAEQFLHEAVSYTHLTLPTKRIV